MADHKEFHNSLLETIKTKQEEFDQRNSRFKDLVDRFHNYQVVNPEQAEAYLVRAKYHEKKLETQISEIVRLQEIAGKILQKAG